MRRVSFQIPDKAQAYVFLLFPLAFLLITSFIPLVWAFYLSFTSYNPLYSTNVPFIGFDNYIKVFSDEQFLIAMKNSIILISGSLALEFGIGLGLALLVWENKKGAKQIRTMLLLPMVVAPVVLGVLWRMLFNPEYGILNFMLSLCGISGKLWLSDPSIALFSVMMVDVWQWTPFLMLILVAGMQSLPTEVYEAARIDGASRPQTFTHITLPLLRTIIAIALLIRFMDGFKIFGTVYILTFGGPGMATEVISLRIYKEGLKFFHIGYASAQSWIFLAFIFTISFFIIKRFIPVGQQLKK